MLWIVKLDPITIHTLWTPVNIECASWSAEFISDSDQCTTYPVLMVADHY